MSKMIAVASTIGGQLRHERPGPLDLNKTMSAGYNYNVDTLSLFLTAISSILATCTPPYYFTFDSTFAQSQLASSVPVLIGAVDAKTSVTPPS